MIVNALKIAPELKRECLGSKLMLASCLYLEKNVGKGISPPCWPPKGRHVLHLEVNIKAIGHGHLSAQAGEFKFENCSPKCLFFLINTSTLP